MQRRPLGEWLLIGLMVLLMCSVLFSMAGRVYLTILGE